MKKLFMFLAVAGLATFGASCSSDDNKSEDPKLGLKADKTDIKVDETVTFTVESNGKAETAADLYKDGTKISNPYKFTEEGEFSIVAKKKGAVDSNAVKIKVTKDGTPGNEKTLKLVADKPAANVGEVVTFTVTDGTGAVVEDAKIKQGNVAVTGNTWTATAAGTFKFTASKEGYTTSNEAQVIVTEAPYEGGVVLSLENEDPNNIFVGEPIDLVVKNNAGQPIEGAVLMVDGQELDFESDEDGFIGISANAPATYNFTVSYKNVVSNVVKVVVKQIEANMSGTVTFDGTTYEVDSSVLFFLGIGSDEAETSFSAVWQVQTPVDGGKLSIVRFYTPAVRSEQGFSYERPTATNTEFAIAAMLQIQGENETVLGQANEGEFAINVTPNEAGTIFTGTSTASATLTGNKAFSQSLDGEFVFADNSRAAANARANSTLVKASKKSSVLKTTSKVVGTKKAYKVIKSIR